MKRMKMMNSGLLDKFGIKLEFVGDDDCDMDVVINNANTKFKA